MPILGPTTDQQEIRQWAESCRALPAELLPHILNHEPSLLQFRVPEQAADRLDVRILSWEEFVLKFETLGLAFVYDDDSSGYNEILQMEEKSPLRNPEYRAHPIDTRYRRPYSH